MARVQWTQRISTANSHNRSLKSTQLYGFDLLLKVAQSRPHAVRAQICRYFGDLGTIFCHEGRGLLRQAHACHPGDIVGSHSEGDDAIHERHSPMTKLT